LPMAENSAWAEIGISTDKPMLAVSRRRAADQPNMS
jgi:hypothetical protein